MSRSVRRLSLGCLFFLVTGTGRGDQPSSPAPGHSLHGEAFDDGPRQAAVLLPGMGEVRFPVTTSSPEAQAFFTQGVAQLHTFYYFEAERSFRQAAKLDPACAMAYWGMAMANQNNGKRARGFIKRARELMGPATERERLYIEALAASHGEGKKDGERREARGGYIGGLESIVLAYPDDLEAKAFLAWALVGGSKPGVNAAVNSLIEEVLRGAPLHPGAHHYRIHLWDHPDPAQALKSALAYARAAPGIAHAWHMPGHIYNGLSRWNEAAYQQEGSARVDHAHMLKHAILPFEIHNYAHNQHYLIANLNHLGRVRDAIDWSRNLIESPRDPQKNDRGGGQRLGRTSLLRVYVRYERWIDLLTDPHLDWNDEPVEAAFRAYGNGLAHVGLRNLEKARAEAEKLDGIADTAAKNKGYEADLLDTARLELRGRLLVAEGKLLEGFDLLHRGAKQQVEKFRGDLAGYPRPFHEILGQAHLAARNWGLAEASFEEALAHRKNMLPSLAGLVEARFQNGKRREAAEAYEGFLAARRLADPDLVFDRRLEAVALALEASGDRDPAAQAGGAPAPGDEPLSSAGPSAAGEPPPVDLETLGPRLWTPCPAPDFTAEDPSGKKVRLADFRGKNVLLLFYLGAACPHCMEQLRAFGKEKAALEALDTAILAVSDDRPEKNQKLLEGPEKDALPFLLLSDSGRAAARLYRAHDDFEDLPLHATVLIDRAGRIRWSRSGAEPFRDVGFLKTEIERVNKLEAPAKGRTLGL